MSGEDYKVAGSRVDGAAERRAGEAEFVALPRLTEARLARLSLSVSGMAPPTTRYWSLRTGSPGYAAETERIAEQVQMWTGSSIAFLYVFRLISPHPHPDEILRAFSAARTAAKGHRAYPRLNGASECMYVGSSQKPHRRLLEHFGFGSPTTYSLQLQHWASELDLGIRIECAKYAEELSPEVVQLLEDTLWGLEQPMFGRRGAK
jgi:hypothetical protein